MRVRSDRTARRVPISFALSAFAIGAMGAIACSSFEEGQDGSSSSSGGLDGGSAESGTIDAGDAGGDEPAPACVDTKSDGRNCGSCGHECLGGSCVDGACQPVEIGHTEDAPVKSIALSATRVFWMTSAAVNGGVGSLYACAKSGCANGLADAWISGENSMGTLASDGATVWASVAYGLERVEMFAPGNGGPTEVPALAIFGALFYMEEQSTRLYVINHNGNDRGIFSWKPGETTATPVGAFSSPSVNTFHASFTPDRLYLGAISANVIETCALANCDASWTTFASPVSSIKSMTNDDQRIYWIEDGGGSVRSCAAGATCAGIEEVLPKSQLGGDAFTVAYSSVSKKIAVLTLANEVVECDPANCTATKRVLAKGTKLDSTYAVYGNVLAADDRSVYYATIDGTTHRVMRVAR